MGGLNYGTAYALKIHAKSRTLRKIFCKLFHSILTLPGSKRLKISPGRANLPFQSLLPSFYPWSPLLEAKEWT